MMLYVFHVDVGRMMSFNMSVAVSSVENLKETIERLHGIPAANIVLLVSGGEMLTHTTQVSYYSAGTDTNPIYMFLTGDAKLPTYLPPAADTDVDLRDQIERCLELPAVYETVATRAQLASQLHELAREEERVCDNLVHEQHLQQQGWSAVVANMEDLTEEFRRRFRNFCLAFDRHLEKRAKYLELLGNFADDLAKLERIPVLPGLLPLAQEDFHGFDEFLDTDEVFSRSSTQQESVLMVGGGGSAEEPCETGDSAGKKAEEEEEATGTPSSSAEDKSSTSPNKKLRIGSDACTTSQTSTTSSNARRRTLNLLQWITSRENHNTLKLMSDECVQGLGTFTEEVYEKLKAEVQNVIKWAEQVDIKEIKGLGERLCKLDEFKYKIKKMVQDQKELSTAFQQNQNRAINLRDNSILPDLCASHRSQLQVMQQNHLKIRDHRRCIAKAKDELGANLHTRLKRIVWLENAMSEFDNRLLFYHRCLRRAERHISIIEQIHQAPNIYVAAVTEVVRRKIFSGEFRTWASKLAEDFELIHTEEIRRRQLFNASFEGHFLNILFPGMGDMPPAFATENPLVFDSRLPNLSRSDIELLASNLPHLSAEIRLPDMGPVINFFVSRSGDHQRDRLEQLLKDQVAAVLNVGGGGAMTGVGGGAERPQHQRLQELQRPCEESETDTETEFEKVRISRSNQDVSTSTAGGIGEEPRRPDVETMARSTTTEQLLLTHSATTMTDDNEASAEEARREVQRLRDLLSTMSRSAVDCIRLTREQLQTCRSDADTCRSDLQSELEMLADKWQLLRMHSSEQESVLKHLLGVRQAELERQAGELVASSNTCAALSRRVDELLQQQGAMAVEVAELREQLAAALAERDQLKAEVAATRDELIREHKTEIESIRCRFKLMTSMERSPSDLSLERIERPHSAAAGDTVEAAHHEAALAQLRAAMEAERERAVAEAIEAERSVWQSKLLPLNSESVMANVGMLKEMLEERDRQLEQMREHDLMQTKENLQLKTRLDALTNEEGNSWLQEKIEYLRRDKTRLEEELTMEKSRRLEMESSFAALKSSTYELPGASGSLTRSKSTASGSSQKLIVLESCAKGDIVFVVWSVRHGQFMVVQDSQSLYFVHSDSLAALNLRLPPASQGRELAGEGAAGGQMALVPVAGGEEHPPQMPMPYYAIGRVIDKEYCQAKKDENRYRVARGSKFYRIKVAPLQHRVATRRERLESFSTSISRSVSQGDSTEISAARQLLPASMESSAATITGRQLGRPGLGKDVADCPTTIVASTSPPIAVGGFPKERTISITSVNEEEDAVAITGGYAHNRYISVSEEDEPAASALTMTLAMEETGSPALQQATLQQPQMTPTIPAPLQQSVITEQPTASSKLKMDLLLASADIVSTPMAAEQEQQQTTECGEAESTGAVPTISTTLLPTISFGGTTTTSEDSDEYRSLEAKDDEDETDFAITE